MASAPDSPQASLALQLSGQLRMLCVRAQSFRQENGAKSQAVDSKRVYG